MSDSTAELADIRSSIDALDRELVGVIARRETLVRRAGALKENADAARAPGRVEQVIGKVRRLASEIDADADVVEATYRAMISAFIELELRGLDDARR